MPWCRLVFVLAVAPACFAEDTIDFVCHERARSPEVLPIDQPTPVTLDVSCAAEPGLTRLYLYAPPNQLGAPSGDAPLTATPTSGLEFRLEGTFTAQSYLDLAAISVRGVNDQQRSVTLVSVDWSAP